MHIIRGATCNYVTVDPPVGLETVFLSNLDLIKRFLVARGVTDPDDLVQELWFHVTSAEIGALANPLSYIMRCAHHLAIDHRRSELKRAERERQWAGIATDLSTEASEAHSADRILIAKEQLKHTDHQVGRLSQKTQTIFYLHRLGGRTRREIAQEVGISISAVGKHLNRAYDLLVELRYTDML